MAATGKTFTGFDVHCPNCATEDATIFMDLNTMECHCGDCELDFTPAEAMARLAEQLRRWRAVERWVALAGECLRDAAG